MRLLFVVPLLLLISACGPSEGDIYEDLLTGQRFEIDRVGECQFEYEVARGLSDRVDGFPVPMILGADSTETCYGVVGSKDGEHVLVLRSLDHIADSERYKKLN